MSSNKKKQEDKEKGERYINIPQLKKTVDGKYLSSHQVNEDIMKRYLTVIVSRENAEKYRLAFTCHYTEDANFYNPFDKSYHINPYSAVLSPAVIRDYYNDIAEKDKIFDTVEYTKTHTEEDVIALRKEYKRWKDINDGIWIHKVSEEVYKNAEKQKNY